MDTGNKTSTLPIPINRSAFSSVHDRFGRACIRAIWLIAVILVPGYTEPIVLKGAAFPGLIGTPIHHIRMCNIDGKPIPFQVDEITKDGEYVCDAGDSPNSDSGNGILDTADEVVFLSDDAKSYADSGGKPVSVESFVKDSVTFYPVVVTSGKDHRYVYITRDTLIAKSVVRYIIYDPATQMLRTPRYYAQFSNNRFHFIRAGIVDRSGKKWINLTRELRVEIFLKALWGILPIRYTEDNLVCYVKRFKVGPIRCIRRGDFHLRLGFGLKGSHASVNQCCYPQMVCVPVSVHVPIKFKRLFSEAWMEMTPVIDTSGAAFTFNVPDCKISEPLGTWFQSDTVIRCAPVGRIFTVQNLGQGYGWLLTTNIPDSSMNGSGFVIRRTLRRAGIAICGFRLEMRNIERGRYTITNRVLFSPSPLEDIAAVCEAAVSPSSIMTLSGTFFNLLNDQ